MDEKLQIKRMPHFGRTDVIFHTSDCDTKCEKFNRTLNALINQYFPVERSKARKCDKP